jgi:peptidyl-prolyl cis-trans isomerase D
MLQSIRDRTQGWLTKTVIGLLVVLFALWGIRGYLALKNENVLAKVAGQILSQQEFDSAYQRLYKRAQSRFGPEALANEEVKKQLRKQTVEQWTLIQLLDHDAYHENYRVSQSMIDSSLLNMPIFQLDGRFSSTQFYNVLNAMGYTERNFLADLKKTLFIEQVQQGITKTAFYLPADFKETIARIQQKRDFAYLTIPRSRFLIKLSAISTAQALDYYRRNRVQFVQPEKVSIEYIQLSMDTIKNAKSFEEKREQLANLNDTHPNALDTVAKKLGLPLLVSAAFDREGGKDLLTSDPKIIATAFSQSVLQGNNSSIIDLQDGTSIVLRIKQHTPTKILAFSEVKNTIRKILQKDIAREKTYAYGETILQELKQTGVSLKTQKLNLKWHVVKQLNRTDARVSPTVIKAVFNLPTPKNGNSVIDGFLQENGDYVLIKLFAVHDGNEKNVTAEQKTSYAKMLENDFGEMDYELYVQNLMQQELLQ